MKIFYIKLIIYFSLWDKLVPGKWLNLYKVILNVNSDVFNISGW